MTTNPQIAAAAASDAYTDRPQSDIDSQKRPVNLAGHEYTIFGYKDDPSNGFHATAYRSKETNEIIIAYRGTDPDFKHHTRTTLQDAAADFTMVKDKLNPQEQAAQDFTREVLEKAQKHGISKENITVAGHSLGGTLAEIEGSRFGLRGTTFNAYGAVNLGYDVPEGGQQLTNYVMAGDVVSAASHHFGKVTTLATEQDLTLLQKARYFDAPFGANEPNPLLAMSLGDHSVTHFTGPDSVLAPDKLAQYETRYAENKTAIDHYRSDVYNERSEISLALRSTDQLNLASTYAHLSPRIQHQILELNAATVDPLVRNAIEHNRLVEGARQGLDQTGAEFHDGGLRGQRAADGVAQGFHSAGENIQGRADQLSRDAQTFVPLNPVLVGGASLGIKVAGYVAHAEAEGYAQASHLAGQAVHATGQLLGDGTQTVKHGLEKGVHTFADAVQSRVHQGEVKLVQGIDHVSAAYSRAEKVVHAAEHSYNDAKRAVSDRVDHLETKASQAYETLKHPGQWFHSDSAPASRQTHAPTVAPPALPHPATPAERGHASNDPRHADNPHHKLYQQLRERVPEASESRLLQFTDACNAKGISEKNLGEIAFDRHGGQMIFRPSSMGPMASVNVKEPSPQPEHSMQHIQQVDRTQTQLHLHSQNAQLNQQHVQ